MPVKKRAKATKTKAAGHGGRDKVAANVIASIDAMMTPAEAVTDYLEKEAGLVKGSKIRSNKDGPYDQTVGLCWRGGSFDKDMCPYDGCVIYAESTQGARQRTFLTSPERFLKEMEYVSPSC